MRKGNKNAKRRKTWRAGRFIRCGRDRIAIRLDDRPLWRINLPVADNDGLVFLGPYVKAFQDYVLKTSGGSTENPWSNGKWVYEGRLYKDRVVPFEFLATTEQADMIAAFACKHFGQTEIMCYPVSDRVRHYHLVRTKNNNWLQSLGRRFAAWLRKSLGRLATSPATPSDSESLPKNELAPSIATARSLRKVTQVPPRNSRRRQVLKPRRHNAARNKVAGNKQPADMKAR